MIALRAKDDLVVQIHDMLTSNTVLPLLIFASDPFSKDPGTLVEPLRRKWQHFRLIDAPALSLNTLIQVSIPLWRRSRICANVYRVGFHESSRYLDGFAREYTVKASKNAFTGPQTRRLWNFDGGLPDAYVTFMCGHH